MTNRFYHTTLMDGRYHVLTSPEKKGLYVLAPSEDAARREAGALLRIIRDHREASGKALADAEREPVELKRHDL